MSTLSQFSGASRVTSLPNGFSSGASGLNVLPGISTLSGATVAGTANLKTLLNLTGSRARLNALAFKAVDATARNVRLVITIDGGVVFDNTVSVADTSARVAVGALQTGATLSLAWQPIDSISSLKIEFGCSLAETDKLTWLYNYEVR